MHSVWKDMLTAFFMGAVVPGMLMNGLDRIRPAPEPAAEETVPPRVVCPMRLKQEDGTVAVLDLEEYLVGVVLGEMPASFEPEALKAQAVVARTYTQKAYETGGKHADGSVCGSPGCCQAYVPEERYLSQGGSREDLEKVRRAVESTAGQVLTYEGALIESTYFSCSGGSTEDAAAVWGTDYPYLQAVNSPGEEGAAHYSDTVTFTAQALREALGQSLPGTPDTWFGEMSRTSGGGVATLDICGQAYTGPQLRRLLGLRSTAFTVQAGKEEVKFITKGYGHRVGMSQYGADAMVASGKTYQEILAHYYQGTKLETK